MPAILPRVEHLVIEPRRNDWGWYTVSGWIGDHWYEMRCDYKPRPHIARRIIRDKHQRIQEERKRVREQQRHFVEEVIFGG